MTVVIAGKNDIAISVTKMILKVYTQIEVLSIFNKNDNGIDGFQKSFKKFCCEQNIKSITLNEAYDIEYTIFLSLEFDQIIKPDKFTHKNIFNIHFSKLPSYKGMYTSAWPILNNECESGVTFHRIDAGIDTGNIIYQKTFKLDESETAKSLYYKYIKYGTKLIGDNLDSILSLEFTEYPQSHENSSYFSKRSIDYSNLHINLNKTAIEIKRQIDAFTFRDYQLVELFGCKVFGCEVLESRSTVKFGSLLREDECCFLISTIDFDIKVYKDRFEDLLEACRVGNFLDVERLLNQFNINEKNCKGCSPVITCAYNGHFHIIKMLVDNGADINDCNYRGTTVFMYAKDHALKTLDDEFLSQLVDLGANVYAQDYFGLTVFDYVQNTKDKRLIDFMERYE